MVIFKEIEPLRVFLNSKRGAGLSIGLVPTMGALHKGHAALIRASKADNQITICSIYINPAQFNNPIDLEKYPRKFEEDIMLLEEEGCEVIFMPSNKEMYNSSVPIQFDFGKLDKVLEGEYRPGHFSGVALVVSKLFNIVQPEKVYFGQKDYQQLQLINHLKDQLKFQLQICSVPIVREDSGLALSSRNARLATEDYTKALMLFEALNYGIRELKAQVEFSDIKKKVEEKFSAEKVAKLEYFELADRESLGLMKSYDSKRSSILLIAAYIGEVRLIDNMLVE